MSPGAVGSAGWEAPPQTYRMRFCTLRTPQAVGEALLQPGPSVPKLVVGPNYAAYDRQGDKVLGPALPTRLC